MKSAFKSRPESSIQNTRSRFDGYLNAAKVSLVMGIVPVTVYWYAFTAFGSSTLPWKIALAIEILCPIVVYVHHYLNHRQKRLIWEGFAVIVGLLPLWFLLGSYWLFYFGFAPIPPWIRAIGLTLGLTITTTWTWLTCQAYAREARKKRLIEHLYDDDGVQLVFSIQSDQATAQLEGLPGASFIVPAGLVSALAPVLLAYTIVSAHTTNTNGGPHGVFIILSALSVPITCWFLKHFFIRIAYFHIYLPIKLERSTGKPVIFDA